MEIYGLQLLRCPESYLAAVEAVAVEGSRYTRSGQTMPRSVHLAVCLGQSISLSPHSLTAEVCFVCLHPSLAPLLPRSLAPSLGVPCSLAPSLARSLLPPSPSLPLSTPVLLVRPEPISQASAARLPGRGRPRGAEPLPNQHTLIGSRRRRANSGAPARARLRADGAGQAGVAEARGRSRAFGVRAAPRPLPCSAAHRTKLLAARIGWKLHESAVLLRRGLGRGCSPSHGRTGTSRLIQAVYVSVRQ